jgi:hypothetical protein
VCGRASESTIIGHIIPESATGIVTTFDICRFQGVTALALTTFWKPWVFAINICGFSFVYHCPAVTFSVFGTLKLNLQLLLRCASAAIFIAAQSQLETHS